MPPVAHERSSSEQPGGLRESPGISGLQGVGRKLCRVGGGRQGNRGRREEAFGSLQSKPPERLQRQKPPERSPEPKASRGPHKKRNTPSCGMERTTATQNNKGGGFVKSPQRNLPEQKMKRYVAGGKGSRKGREEGNQEGLVSRDFQGQQPSAGPEGSFAGLRAPSQGEDNKRPSATEEN